jgi:hypothetical protein
MKQFHDGVSNDPLELILAVKAAALNFNNTHTSVAGFKNVIATVQVKRFSLWAFAVYKGHIKETSFNINPDNKELQSHCKERHTKCLMPSLTTIASAPTSMRDQVSILKQLGAGLH